MHHEQKQSGKERVDLILQLQFTVYHEGNSRQETRTRDGCRGHGGMQLAGWLSQPAFLPSPGIPAHGTAISGLGLPIPISNPKTAPETWSQANLTKAFSQLRLLSQVILGVSRSLQTNQHNYVPQSALLGPTATTLIITV